MRSGLLLAILVTTLGAGLGPAIADDWTAVRLRGTVLVNENHGVGPWQRLRRGDVVPDDRFIRTLANGNVEFTRGAETIAFAPDTQGEIVDRTGKLYTTVVQQFGKVAVEAEARRVQHFAVETPFLVAVVKGTVFTVTTDPKGSRVAVSRGLVAVTDRARHRTYAVPAGRQLDDSPSGAVTLSGAANAALTHPVVNGVVEDADTTTGASGLLAGTTGTLGDVLGTTTGALGSTVSHVTGALGGSTGGALGSTVSSVGNTVGTTVGSVGGTVGSTVGSVGSTVGSVVGSTTGAVGGLVGGTLHHLGL